jgi:hypothetical protein
LPSLARLALEVSPLSKKPSAEAGDVLLQLSQSPGHLDPHAPVPLPPAVVPGLRELDHVVDIGQGPAEADRGIGCQLLCRSFRLALADDPLC